MYAPLLGFGKATDVPHEEIYLIHMMSVFFEAAKSSKPQHQFCEIAAHINTGFGACFHCNLNSIQPI